MAGAKEDVVVVVVGSFLSVCEVDRLTAAFLGVLPDLDLEFDSSPVQQEAHTYSIIRYFSVNSVCVCVWRERQHSLANCNVCSKYTL